MVVVKKKKKKLLQAFLKYSLNCCRGKLKSHRKCSSKLRGQEMIRGDVENLLIFRKAKVLFGLLLRNHRFMIQCNVKIR